MVFMPGRRQRSASSKQMAEMAKDMGCAVARAVTQESWTLQISSSIMCFTLGMACRENACIA